MIRNKRNIKQADAILTADWHLRDTVPECRTDDFYAAQWKKLDFISALQKKHNCSVYHAGDLFHHWKPSPSLLTDTIKHIPKRFVTVYGNHDVPQHNLELVYKSGIRTLETAGIISVFPNGTNFGNKPNPDKPSMQGDFTDEIYRKVLVWHEFTYKGKPPWPGCEADTGNKLLNKYPGFDLILTGDNHQSFTAKKDGRVLVNAGNITRQSAAQIDFKPCVYLWYAKTNTVEPVYIPVEEGVVSREHIEKVTQRDERLDAFISKLDDNWDIGISFEENLKRFLQKNKINKHVKRIINRAIDTE